MTVKELKKILRRLESNTIILVPSGDNNFKAASANVCFAIKSNGGRFTEYIDDNLSETEFKIKAVVIE